MSVLEHVTSFTDGRVRLRHPALKDLRFSEMVTAAVTSVEGIRSADVNPRTGSLLITYDSAAISRGQLAAMAEAGLAFLPAEEKPEPVRKRAAQAVLSRRATKAANRLMLLSFLASMGGICAGLGGVHRIAGLVFALAGLQHVAAHRKTL